MLVRIPAIGTDFLEMDGSELEGGAESRVFRGSVIAGC
jgi:hypothetical protein